MRFKSPMPVSESTSDWFLFPILSELLVPNEELSEASESQSEVVRVFAVHFLSGELVQTLWSIRVWSMPLLLDPRGIESGQISIGSFHGLRT